VLTGPVVCSTIVSHRVLALALEERLVPGGRRGAAQIFDPHPGYLEREGVMGVIEDNELPLELLEEISAVAELIKPYYQEQFDNIAIEKINGVLQIITERFDFTGENIRLTFEGNEDGPIVITEGKPYIAAFFKVSQDVLTAEEASEYVYTLSDEWSIYSDTEVSTVPLPHYYIEVKRDWFTDAYGRILDFLTEITTATAFCESIKAIRERDMTN
jgi:hypothetical protein